MTVKSILHIPDIFSAKRILCIQPHYDDNDIGAGGTIAPLAQNGVDAICLTATSWKAKISAVRCYQTQFEPDGMDELVMALDLKSRQAAMGTDFEHGEALKMAAPRALHCGY